MNLVKAIGVAILTFVAYRFMPMPWWILTGVGLTLIFAI